MKIEKLLEKFKAQRKIEWIEEEEGGRPRAKTFRGRQATDERTKSQGGWTKDDWKPATSNHHQQGARRREERGERKKHNA